MQQQKQIHNSCNHPSSVFFKVFLTKYKILKRNIQTQNDNISNFSKDKIIDNKKYLFEMHHEKKTIHVAKIKAI